MKTGRAKTRLVRRPAPPALHLLLLACLGLLPAAAYGQITALAPPKSAQEKDEPATVHLVLHPAAEPRPAMKYLLYPPYLDRHPGNAAVTYGRGAALDSDLFRKGEVKQMIADWVEMPLEKLPREEMHKWLDRGSYLHFLDMAARRDSVDWELPLREEDPIAVLLPEVQHMREFARIIAAKARLHVAEGKFDEAVYSLQTGFAMARQVRRRLDADQRPGGHRHQRRDVQTG